MAQLPAAPSLTGCRREAPRVLHMIGRVARLQLVGARACGLHVVMLFRLSSRRQFEGVTLAGRAI